MRQWNTRIRLNEEMEVKMNSRWRETRVEVPARHRELKSLSLSECVTVVKLELKKEVNCLRKEKGSGYCWEIKGRKT